MSKQHTSGPWEYSPDSLADNDGAMPIRGNVTEDDFELVARVVLKEKAARGQGYTFGFGDDAERDANCRLIESAPLLLEIADELSEWLKHDGAGPFGSSLWADEDETTWVEHVNAVLAKVQGKA